MCPYCKTQITITRSNWARHLQRKHPEVISEHEEALSTQRTEQQSKLPFKVVALPNKAARCLALYAATTTMPLYHVENKYFKVAYSSESTTRLHVYLCFAYFHL